MLPKRAVPLEASFRHFQSIRTIKWNELYVYIPAQFSTIFRRTLKDVPHNWETHHIHNYAVFIRLSLLWWWQLARKAISPHLTHRFDALWIEMQSRNIQARQDKKTWFRQLYQHLHSVSLNHGPLVYIYILMMASAFQSAFCVNDYIKQKALLTIVWECIVNTMEMSFCSLIWNN